MTITLDLTPDIEQGLLAQAQAKGVSITDYVEEIIKEQALRARSMTTSPAKRTGQEIIDASARVRGLLTDEEVDSLFSRSLSMSRPVDFS